MCSMQTVEGTGIQSTALGSNRFVYCRGYNHSRKSLRPRGYIPGGVASKDAGVVISQVAKSVGTQPSPGGARHGDHNEHGTAQDMSLGMDKHLSDIPCQLRVPF
jgi:hypothetical protein